MARKTDPQKRAAGRKSTAWIDEFEIKNPGMRQFLLVYSRVGTISGACRELGFGLAKITNWRKGFTTKGGMPNKPTEEGDRFEQAFVAAKTILRERLEAECDKRALRGSDNLLMFRLKALAPEMYRESWRTAGGPTTPTNPQVQIQVNQLIQAATQDPEKMKQVLELAKQYGLLHRLMGPGEIGPAGVAALTKGDLGLAPVREVVKNAIDAKTGEYLPERGEEDLETPEVIDKDVK